MRKPVKLLAAIVAAVVVTSSSDHCERSEAIPLRGGFALSKRDCFGASRLAMTMLAPGSKFEAAGGGSPLTEEQLLEYSRVIWKYGVHIGILTGGLYWNYKIETAQAQGDIAAVEILRDLLRGTVACPESGTAVVNKRTGKAVLLIGVSKIGKSKIAQMMVSSAESNWMRPDPESDWYLGTDDYFLAFFIGGRLVVGRSPRAIMRHCFVEDFLHTRDFFGKGFYTQIPNSRRFFEVANIVAVTYDRDLPNAPQVLWGQADGFGFKDSVQCDPAFGEKLFKQKISKVVIQPNLNSDDCLVALREAIEKIKAAHFASLDWPAYIHAVSDAAQRRVLASGA